MYPLKGRGFGHVTLFNLGAVAEPLVAYAFRPGRRSPKTARNACSTKLVKNVHHPYWLQLGFGLNALCIYKLRATGGLTIRGSRGKPRTRPTRDTYGLPRRVYILYDYNVSQKCD